VRRVEDAIARLHRLYLFGRTARRAGWNSSTALVRDRASEWARTDTIECEIELYRQFLGKVYLQGRIVSHGVPVIGIGLRTINDDRPAGVNVTINAPMGEWQQFSVACPRPGHGPPTQWRIRAALADGTWRDISDAPQQAINKEPHSLLLPHFIETLAQRPSGTLVEIGSRARSGHVYKDLLPSGWNYVGVDIVPGPNVDVVADAHSLASHFAPGSVDAVLAISTFEHLLMPWKAVLELNRMLAIGGRVMVASHQTWPLHDEPCDYWRFSADSWHALFNAGTGFHVDEVGMGQKADVVPLVMNGATANMPGQPALLASGVIATKVAETALSWPVDRDMIADAPYPA
jgi:hypothetical protein